MGKVPVTQSVIELIEPVLMANGLELVDVEFKKEGKSWVLRIYIDKESGLTLADCQKVSGLAGDLIEVEDHYTRSRVQSLAVSVRGTEHIG